MLSPTNFTTLTITGASSATTIIDANHFDRVFHVHLGFIATISGVTIRNGFIAGFDGGGIYNEGFLSLSDSTSTGNHSTGNAGGIANDNGLTVTTSTISMNIADLKGDGIRSASGNVTVINSTVSHNNAGTNGGGIYVATGAMLVRDSTISDNAGFDGGGIDNQSTLYVINSTLSQNTANNNGGGIYSHGALNIYNTSIVGNSAGADISLGGTAGGVFNDSAVVNLRNTLVAGNNVNNSPIYDDCTGILTSFGRNLFGDVIGCTINNASGGAWTFLNSKTFLGPLQNNGGRTWTVALLPGNNAIDGADPVFGCTDNTGSTIPTDQRGLARAVGVRCDIGAFEFAPATLDVDASITATKYDALTDGLIIIRYLFGLTGPALTNAALGGSATRTDPAVIKTYLDSIRPALDIDGNNTFDVATDGLLIMRYIFGLRGSALIAGAVGPLGARHSATDIQTYIQSLMP